MFDQGLLGGNITISWCSGQPISAEQLVSDAARLTQQLVDIPGNTINLANNRYLFSVTLFSCGLCGKTTLLPQNQSQRNLIFLQDKHKPNSTWRDSDIEAALSLNQSSEIKPLKNSLAIIPDTTALTAFTSGSTGTPKPEHKSWQQLYTQLNLLNQRLFPDNKKTNIVSTVPPQHIYGLELSVLLPLFFGHAAHSGRPFFPADIAKALGNIPAPRVLVTVPLHLRACVEANIDWPDIDLIISATAPLDVELAKRAENTLNTRILEQYGTTETGGIATRFITSNTIWQTLDQVKVYLKNHQVYAEAPHLSVPTPLYDNMDFFDGGFKLLSRHQNMIKIAGKRNTLTQLDLQLQSIAGVKEGIFFIPTSKENREARLAAFVVAPTLDGQGLLQKLSEYMDPVFLPQPLIFVDQLPKNNIGKITQESLMNLFEQHKKTSLSK